MIVKISKLKGIASHTIHHLLTSTALPVLVCGSESWWTGAEHIPRLLGPTFNAMAKYITGIPTWTPIPLLLAEAGLPPMNLYLDNRSRSYGIRVLLAANSHPCKNALIAEMHKPQPDLNWCRLSRIAKLRREIIPYGRLEDPTHQGHQTLPPAIISPEDKKEEGTAHQEWLKNLAPGIAVLYTDGFRADNGTTASAWHCLLTTNKQPTELFEECCNIGDEADVEDGEIHGIQEGIHNLKHLRPSEIPKVIYLCVDNYSALKALSGGPMSSRYNLRKCLEDMEILQQAGCRIQGKWTPSHQNILGNERADTLAK